MKTIVSNLTQLTTFAKELKNLFGDNCVVLLRGTLGAGKSTLVQTYAKEIDIKDQINSPTFTIGNNYDDKLFHYDIYRVGSDEFIQMGLAEELDRSGIHFIEWADEKIENYLKTIGMDYFIVNISLSDNTREFEVIKCIS